VRHPFRFTVPITTPNDHRIPFRLTMTCNNGLEPSDTNTYTFESRFYLIVQRGTELPTIISENMTLTKDYYWLVPDQTMIASGVVVTVTAGTQIQFYSSVPSDPYSSDPLSKLLVNGTLTATGTFTEPIEMFLASNYAGLVTDVREANGGSVELRYVQMENPRVQATIVDHGYFWWSGLFTNPYYYNGTNLFTDDWHYVHSEAISSTIFTHLGPDRHEHWYNGFHFRADVLSSGGDSRLDFVGSMVESIVEGAYFHATAPSDSPNVFRDNVFLLNTRINQYGGFVDRIKHIPPEP
jgi:hypothetical protein